MGSGAGHRIGVDVGGSKVLAGRRHEQRRGVPDRPPQHARAAGPGRGRRGRGRRGGDRGGRRRTRGHGRASRRRGSSTVTGRRVVFAPHLPWRGEDVRGRLERRLGTPVLLDNDATCAAHAEATYGAGRGAASMLLVTLGTGIGGGLVLDGRVWRGHHGMAGEFGHMQVVPDGAPCECGRRGCWEQYSSGNALVRAARSRLATEPTVLAELCEGDPQALTGPMVTDAAAAGDLVARAAFASVGRWLGVGLANLVAAFDPALLVVGGGVADAGERCSAPPGRPWQGRSSGPGTARCRPWSSPRSARRPAWSVRPRWRPRRCEAAASTCEAAPSARPRSPEVARPRAAPELGAVVPGVALGPALHRRDEVAEAADEAGHRARSADQRREVDAERPAAHEQHQPGRRRRPSPGESAGPAAAAGAAGPVVGRAVRTAPRRPRPTPRALGRARRRGPGGVVGRRRRLVVEPGPVSEVVDDRAPGLVLAAPVLTRTTIRQVVTRATKSADSANTISASLSSVATW